MLFNSVHTVYAGPGISVDLCAALQPLKPEMLAHLALTSIGEEGFPGPPFSSRLLKIISVFQLSVYKSFAKRIGMVQFNLSLDSFKFGRSISIHS